MRSAFLAACALTLALPATAHAFVSGQTTGAAPLPLGGHIGGLYGTLSGDALGLLGQLRLSLHPEIDFGFQGGLVRNDLGPVNRTSVRLGADFKARVHRATAEAPFDLALGGALAVDTAEDFTSLAIGPVVIASRDLVVGEGQTLTPYLGLGLLVSRFDVDDEDRNDVSLPVRAGLDYGFAPGLRIVGEFQLNLGDSFRDDVGVLAGVNLPF
jgi:hypothetical protein